MDIQCKRHYLLVQNIDFRMETDRNDRSNNVITDTPTGVLFNWLCGPGVYKRKRRGVAVKD